VPSYTVGYIDVYRNGVRLVSTDFTATTGTTVVLANACTVGDAVVTESFLVSSVLNAIPNTGGSVSASNLAASGTGSSSNFLRGDMAWTSATGTGSVALASLPTFSTTIGVGGATASASGSGISFPATQSASSDANTLDDYEEGTFTPTFTNLGAGATKSGAYVKVGRMVFVNLFFQNMGCTGTVSVTIGGLPFTRSSSVTSDGDALTPYELYQISNPTGNIMWLFSLASTTVSMFAYNGTTGASLNTSNFSNATATLGISGWYQTAT
jgi:hypothetical protein